MARETKVGLIAGLAFIVSFAVILTHGGDRNRLRPGQVAVTTPQENAPRRPRPMPTAGPQRVDRRSERVYPPTTRTDARQASPRTLPQQWQRSQPQGQVPARQPEPFGRPASTQDQFRTDQPRREAGIHPAPTSLSSPTRAGDVRRMNVETPPQSIPQRQPESIQSERARMSEPRASHEPVPRRLPESQTQPRPRPRAVLARYTVVPGDTLTRIAAKHYGAGSRQFVNAIVDANRTVIANPDVLRAGMELLIPEVPGRTHSTEPRATERAATPRPSNRPLEAAYRWYQIKPNDRYITIAREQLGDSGRWHEIYELNKDKFPDPGRIQTGVRIKLPPAGRASSGGRS